MTSADVTNVANKAMHWKRWDGLAAQGGDAVVKFTSSSGESRSVTLLDGTSVQNQVTAINAAAKDLGIYALWAGEAGTISVQSSNSFTVAKTSAGVTTAGFGHMAAPTASANADATLSATAAAESALARLGNAVTSLGNVQGRVGAGQNKLQYAIQLAQSQISNYSAAESRIRDADVAAEAANLTKAQVLQQASLAAMAQANSAPQAVMALLRG
jgi:flagellin